MTKPTSSKFLPPLLELNSSVDTPQQRSVVMKLLISKTHLLKPDLSIDMRRRSEILSFLSHPIVRSYMSTLRKRASQHEDGMLMSANTTSVGDTISFALPQISETTHKSNVQSDSGKSNVFDTLLEHEEVRPSRLINFMFSNKKEILFLVYKPLTFEKYFEKQYSLLYILCYRCLKSLIRL